MHRNLNLQTLCVALGLMVIGLGTAAAQDPPPPQPIQQQTAPQQSQQTIATVPGDTLNGDCECDCLKCRCLGFWKRQYEICHHDKCFFHYYIRGNGPAIHTRPAGFYWW